MGDRHSCDTLLSAILITVVVVMMGLIALQQRSSHASTQPVPKPQNTEHQSQSSEAQPQSSEARPEYNETLLNACFYLHSTIAQVLAAAFALLLVVALPWLQHRFQESVRLAEEEHVHRARSLVDSLRRTYTDAHDVHFENTLKLHNHDLGVDGTKFLKSAKCVMAATFIDICLSLVAVTFAPHYSQTPWLAYLTMTINTLICGGLLISMNRIITGCFRQYESRFSRVSLSDEKYYDIKKEIDDIEKKFPHLKTD